MEVLTCLAWSTLDQLTAMHILIQVHPQCDEFDAVREEHEGLFKEIVSLERYQVCLEQRIYEAGQQAKEEG